MGGPQWQELHFTPLQHLLTFYGQLLTKVCYLTILTTRNHHCQPLYDLYFALLTFDLSPQYLHIITGDGQLGSMD